ncbi:unnamed protein product [Amoebophrya sp. A25]|nr:unnamed protein product [Amoebophrya sp. A25]|eukprot:GSA25T00002192001.1
MSFLLGGTRSSTSSKSSNYNIGEKTKMPTTRDSTVSVGGRQSRSISISRMLTTSVPFPAASRTGNTRAAEFRRRFFHYHALFISCPVIFCAIYTLVRGLGPTCIFDAQDIQRLYSNLPRSSDVDNNSPGGVAASYDRKFGIPLSPFRTTMIEFSIGLLCLKLGCG